MVPPPQIPHRSGPALMKSFQTLTPDWHLPGVHACTLLAEAADGSPVSFSFHTELGEACRHRLQDWLQMPDEITWLKQVHGDTILELPHHGSLRPEADASVTDCSGTVCVVMTADCLPVVFSTADGKTVGAVHAGRKGLENGILTKMVARMGDPENLWVWIGPGIGPESYRVSEEMRAYFLERYPQWPSVFTEVSPGQYTMDLQRIAQLQLTAAGVPAAQVSGAQWDTFTSGQYHSARRDGAASGRMATLIWKD
jgi:YfiH family protein